MNKPTLTVVFLLFQIIAFGQDNKLVKDIDNDGVKDTVYIDENKSTLVCKLSTKKFKSISSRSFEIWNMSYGVTKTKNGFEFFTDGMRAGYKSQFRYNSKTEKIQLIGMSIYDNGTGAFGFSESSVNLITGTLIKNQDYYDEKGKLTSAPTIKTKMKFKEINLEDFGTDTLVSYAKRCAEL